MHNKEYALKLVQDKQNGLNGYSYSRKFDTFEIEKLM